MKVPSFSTTMARQRYDAEVEARQREYDATFKDGKRMTKFYLVAEVDDGLPPIKQEISLLKHAAYVSFEKGNLQDGLVYLARSIDDLELESVREAA